MVGLAAMPLASQNGGDAALDAACRSTEITAPASCPCTITKARAVGVSDEELGSLFKDDGHSNPVPQATYTRFWQVKSQCIADATMASLGITPGNPLPGVPANMRPGMPLGGSGPMTARPSGPEPRPSSQRIGTAPGYPAPAASQPRPQQARRDLQPTPQTSTRRDLQVGPNRRDLAGGQCDGDGFGGANDVIVCGDTGVLETKLIYDSKLDQYPELVRVLKRKANATFQDLSKGRTRRDRYAYIVTWNLSAAKEPLISVSGSDGDTSRGRLVGADTVLWDNNRQREIAWSDVFEPAVWNGRLRRDYCAKIRALKAERNEVQFASQDRCPELSELSVALSKGDAGEPVLRFWGATGVVASYANSAFYDGIALPIEGSILAAVKAPYRELFGATGEIPAIPLRDRLSNIETVLAGEIGASDDYYFIIGGAERFTSASQFDRLFQSTSPKSIMTLYDPPRGDGGYSIILDGKQHNMRRVSTSADYKTQTFSDGTVTVVLEQGQAFTNNPAFGYRLDTLTITKGSESDRFDVMNFGGA
ncbi:MAG: hypothetical protein AAF707_04755 [Pseudomonadota bacterium]